MIQNMNLDETASDIFAENYWTLKNSTIQEYEENISRVRDKIIKDMSQASREVWKCDPPKHVRGKWYQSYAKSNYFERRIKKLIRIFNYRRIGQTLKIRILIFEF